MTKSLDTLKKYYSSGENVQSSCCRLSLKICDVTHVKKFFRSSNASNFSFVMFCLFNKEYILVGLQFDGMKVCLFWYSVINLLSQRTSLSLKRNRFLLGADYKTRVVSAKRVDSLCRVDPVPISLLSIILTFRYMGESSSQLALLGGQKLPIRLM